MVKVQSAGIDTWSPCWYVGEDTPAARAMTALATQPTARGKLIPGDVDGHRVGWFPSSQLVYAEGHPVDDRLGSGSDLAPRLESLTTALGDLGVPLPLGRTGMTLSSDLSGVRRPGLAGVRRLDVTVDFVGSSAEGIAAMTGIAALEPPRADVAVRRHRGAIETVTWLGARGILARAYDKGVESGSHARGERTRLEGQYRWGVESRRDPAELTATYLRDKFVGRFAPLWKASKGIKVVGRMALVNEIRDQVEAGDLTVSQAEQVLGSQLLMAGGTRYPHKTRQRRRRLVRETGLMLADGVLEEVEVDLHDVLGEILETDAWERQG
jgi:hypothetical protein